jgi:hypothetical protein
MTLRVPAIVALVAAALMLSGCVSIQQMAASQHDTIGDVEVTLTGTASDGAHAATGQLLLGVRLPGGARAPETFQATTDGPPQTLTFTRNGDYSAQLDGLMPAGAARRWAGYKSSLYDYAPSGNGTQRTVTATLRIGLPSSPDGAPYGGQFRLQPVIGGQITAEATDRVDCADAQTRCVDSAGSDTYVPTRDVGILAGSATLSPGQRVDLPFDAHLVGSLPAGTTFFVTASSGVPGVTAAPSLRSFAPSANSSTRITVPVHVPKRAGPGTFPVSVTANLPNGQTRMGTAQVTIRDRQPPALTRARLTGAKLSYSLSEAATVKVAIQRCVRKRHGKCRRYKARRGSLAAKGVKGANVLQLGGYFRGRKLRPASYRLVLTPTDLKGNRGTGVKVAFTIKRK